MSWNPALSYFVERLSGFSNNTFTLQPTNQSNNITANDIITFNLPANSILNLRSFSVHFNATTSAASGARFGPRIDNLFERVEVLAGGISLSQGTNFYNVLCAAKQALSGRGPSAVNGHPAMIREFINTRESAALAAAASEQYSAANGECQFSVSNFEGFLSSAEPRCLDSSILPDLQVRIYLASNSVLAKTSGVLLGVPIAIAANAGPTGKSGDGFGANPSFNGLDALPAPVASYSLNNLHATIECISLADATYDSMLAEQLNSVGYVEVPFETYYGFNNVHNGSTRFSVASQSIDKIYAVWRATNYNTQQTPICIQGYKMAGCLTAPGPAAPAGVANVNQEMGKPQYDIGGSLDTNKEKWTTVYQNFKSPAGWTGAGGAGVNIQNDVRYQFVLNGANVPQSQSRDEDMHVIAMNAELGYNRLEEMSLDQMRENYFVQCIRLNMPTNDYRLISGADSRAVNLQGAYNTVGVLDAAKSQCTLFVQCRASLKIGAGRALELIH